MAENDESPKIHVDSDWKEEARREKEKLSEASKQADEAQDTGAQAGPGGMPPANFETLISTLATQALFAMGAIADPRTGQPTQNLPLARHHIDMLGVIEEKTEGNLSEEEKNLLAGTLYELRSRYIQAGSGGGSNPLAGGGGGGGEGGGGGAGLFGGSG